MEKKNGLYVGLVIVLILGAVAYPKVRWFQFQMKVRDTFASHGGLGRFPSRDQMMGIEAKAQQFAKDFKIEGLKVQFELEGRPVAGDIWWYWNADFSAGSKTFRKARRIETRFTDDDVEWFGEQGVKLKLPVAAEED